MKTKTIFASCHADLRTMGDVVGTANEKISHACD